MIPDEALFDRLVAGDLAAFDALYERYERHLYGFIVKHLSDRQEAEDAFHDAFMAVLREREAGGAKRCFRAWLFQVARNLCLNRIRARRRSAAAMEAAAHVPAAPAPHPERALADRERAAALRTAVGRLPAPLAELFELRAAGMSYDEMAEVLEIPVGTVKSRMHEMVSRLREEVES